MSKGNLNGVNLYQKLLEIISMMLLHVILVKLLLVTRSSKFSNDMCKITKMLKSSLSKDKKKKTDRSSLKQCSLIKILKLKSRKLSIENLE